MPYRWPIRAFLPFYPLGSETEWLAHSATGHCPLEASQPSNEPRQADAHGSRSRHPLDRPSHRVLPLPGEPAHILGHYVLDGPDAQALPPLARQGDDRPPPGAWPPGALIALPASASISIPLPFFHPTTTYPSPDGPGELGETQSGQPAVPHSRVAQHGDHGHVGLVDAPLGSPAAARRRRATARYGLGASVTAARPITFGRLWGGAPSERPPGGWLWGACPAGSDIRSQHRENNPPAGIAGEKWQMGLDFSPGWAILLFVTDGTDTLGRST